MQEQAEEEERLKRQDAIDGRFYVNFFTTVTAIDLVSFEMDLFFEREGGDGQFLCFTLLKTISCTSYCHQKNDTRPKGEKKCHAPENCSMQLIIIIVTTTTSRTTTTTTTIIIIMTMVRDAWGFYPRVALRDDLRKHCEGSLEIN